MNFLSFLCWSCQNYHFYTSIQGAAALSSFASLHTNLSLLGANILPSKVQKRTLGPCKNPSQKAHMSFTDPNVILVLDFTWTGVEFLVYLHPHNRATALQSTISTERTRLQGHTWRRVRLSANSHLGMGPPTKHNQTFSPLDFYYLSIKRSGVTSLHCTQ